MLTCSLQFHWGSVTMALRILTSYYKHFTCSYEYITNRYVYFTYSYVLFTIWANCRNVWYNCNLFLSYAMLSLWLSVVSCRMMIHCNLQDLYIYWQKIVSSIMNYIFFFFLFSFLLMARHYLITVSRLVVRLTLCQYLVLLSYRRSTLLPMSSNPVEITIS